MISVGSSLKAALRSPLLPFWLVIALLPVGRSSELGTVLCLLGVILLFARHPNALLEHTGARLLLWLLAGYVGAAVISSVDSVVPGKSWGTVVAILRYVPLGLYACFAIRREDKLQALYDGVSLVVVLWAADAWIQALTGWSLGGHAEAERISGIFGATNLKLGPTLAVLSPFALWTTSRRWGLPGLLLCFAFLLGPVLLAGSRAAWFCYGLVALAFLWREAKSPRRFLLFCAFGAIVLVLGAGIAWKTSERFHTRMDLTLLALHGDSQSMDTALSGRLDIWHASSEMIAAHPINGVGVRGFRYAYPHYAPANDHFLVAESCGEGEGACHPHQLILEILTETGGIGLLLWIAAAVKAFRAHAHAGQAARVAAFPATVALGVMLFPLNTHLAFYSAWWGLLFGWLLGLWCAALYVEPSTAEGEQDERIPAMSREPLSVVVITYNNADTLDECLRKVDWADEIVVLDSGSTDATVSIAERHDARVAEHPFDDYGPQKQRAYDMASHDWILNLDADEILSPGTREVIEAALVSPHHAGFRLPRRERMFWTVQHRLSWRNAHLRLFDRRRGGMNDVEVHAAVEVRGPVKTLHKADFVNNGDGDIATRVEKINRYTTGMVAYKLRKRQRYAGVRMVLYPPLFFLRQYVGKRYFLNGWAGFIASVTGAFYAFLKYAKLHEAQRAQRTVSRSED